MSSTCSHPLCKFCKPIPEIASRLHNISNIPFYKSIEALQASAASGCQLCSWLVEHFPRYVISKIKSLEYIAQSGAQYFALMFLIDRRLFFQAFYTNGRPSAAKDRITGRVVCVDPVDAISQVAIPWLSTCETTHGLCRQPKQCVLPTRILKVGGDEGDVVLVDTQGQEGQYAILSYCWGLGETLQTTPLTLEARKRGIPYEDLPLTLRHAVQVTRQLRIKYLWIDALCIIQEQNPPTDWLTESGKMLDYYRNAYVTIGNLDGEASSSGFLFPRKDTSLTIPGHDELSFRVTSHRTYWSIYANSVLATRAWCLQERLISTRLLLFGKDQLFWECGTCCEREGVVVAGEIRTPVEEVEHEMMRVLARLGAHGMTLRESMNTWYTIVEQYTERHLTRATDILIPISGVADEIRPHAGYDYVHGLWKQDWCRGLVWSRRPGGKATGAPSWSWASNTGVVGFKVVQRSEDSRFNTSFEDQMIILETVNQDREIHVRAKCRQIDSRVIFEGRGGEGQKTNIFVFWDGTEEPYGREYVELDEHDEDLPKTMYRTSNTRLQYSNTKDFADSEVDTDGPPSTMYKAVNALLRCSYTVELGFDDELVLSGYFTVSYLLLALDEKEKGKWRRVGLGTYQQDVRPKKIGYDDLGSEASIMTGELRPDLLFDDCGIEDVWIV